MPKFLYTAKNEHGQTSAGNIDAKNERDVALQLRAKGLIVTSIEAMEESHAPRIKFIDRIHGVSLKEKLFFTRNLSVMVSSGLTIARSIANLSVQTKNKHFREILEDIYTNVQKGKTLSETLAKYPAVFNDLFVNMIRVGEIGGTLEESLDIVTEQMAKDHDLRSKVKGAMIYPAVIIVVMILVGVVMLTYVLPQILSVFEDLDVVLPATTQVIIAISNGLKEYHTIIAIVLIGGGAFLHFFSKTDRGKKTFSFLFLHLPIIRNIVLKVNCARFARIYSSLLHSGVSVVDSLGIVARTLTNTYFQEAILDAQERIQRGIELSRVIKEYPAIFPVIVGQMVQVGEETGQTEKMLIKLAEFYEEEVNQITKNLSSIIEPILMLLIGGAVGFFAVSMLTPMYSVMSNI